MMTRSQALAPTPVLTVLLLCLFLGTICEGSISGCTVYPFIDSPFNDINSGEVKDIVTCAEECSANLACIGFVVSPLSNCWLKNAVTMNNLFPTPDRTLITTGRNNCTTSFMSLSN